MIGDADYPGRPERYWGEDRPAEPEPGKVIHVVDQRLYLRWNSNRGTWEEVERHRPCENWIRKGDPVEFHTHACIDGKTPTVVYQCSNCVARYRLAREDAPYFYNNHEGKCPTCGTPLPEEPRDAFFKDFR